jgi:hypothetical protein
MYQVPRGGRRKVRDGSDESRLGRKGEAFELSKAVLADAPILELQTVQHALEELVRA